MYKVYIKIGTLGRSVCSSVQFIYLYKGTYPEYPEDLPT